MVLHCTAFKGQEDLQNVKFDKRISFQIVTSEELQNLKVGCSTNSVVDVIRPIFLACTANSLTNLTKSAIPRLFLEKVHIHLKQSLLQRN